MKHIFILFTFFASIQSAHSADSVSINSRVCESSSQVVEEFRFIIAIGIGELAPAQQSLASDFLALLDQENTKKSCTVYFLQTPFISEILVLSLENEFTTSVGKMIFNQDGDVDIIYFNSESSK